VRELVRHQREKITKKLHVDNDWQRGDADAAGFGPNREDILAFRIEAPEGLESALIRPGHIECADQPQPLEAVDNRPAGAIIDELDNRLGARLHPDIIGDPEGTSTSCGPGGRASPVVTRSGMPSTI
jgi:hypothetical protein